MTTPNLKIEQDANLLRMTIDGEFNLQNIQVLQQFLVASTERNGDEVLSFINIETIDVAAIQLAIVWKHSLQKQGRKATVILPEASSQQDLFEKSGITKLL